MRDTNREEADLDFENFFKQIVDIFSRNSSKNYVNFSKENRFVWFENILNELKIFGINESIYLTPDQVPTITYLNKSNNVVKLNKVSISRYLLLEINSLYQRSLLNLYPNLKDWSHAGVYHILNNIVNGKIKLQFINNISDLDKFDWIDIKRFSNMVMTMIYCSSLSVSDSSKLLYVKEEAEKYFRQYFSPNQEIVLDSDRVLLSTTLKNYKEENNVIFSESSMIRVVGCSDYKSGLEELNRVCRKYNIDIIP